MAALPELTGNRISISARGRLTAHRGKLLSGSRHGTPVHAASFIRSRQVVLERELLEEPPKLRLILVHEIFHFVWVRLGNPARESFTRLLTKERHHNARGELGESSAARKELDSWKDYVCESFCDTAAWMYAAVHSHADFTLSARWRNQRKAWFESLFGKPHKC